MLGCGHMFSKSYDTQRRRLDVSDVSNNKSTDKIIKEQYRKTKLTNLANKYFNKIVKAIIKANAENRKFIHFYYNYYDFVNNGLGKPHGFLNEFMYEMSYEYSEYVTKDEHGNPMTFKTLFGNDFKWELHGKNMMIISW